MQKNIRLFIAVPIPQFLKEALQECGEWLKNYPEMKHISDWVKAEKMHLTLHFLGETPYQKVEQVQSVVEEANQYDLPTFTMKDIDTFSKNGLPSVLWVKINTDKKLIPLYNRLAQKLEEIGIETEKRTYNPHVTLAYIRASDSEKRAIVKRLEKIIVGEIGTWKAEKVELVSSTLTKEGYVYKVLN